MILITAGGTIYSQGPSLISSEDQSIVTFNDNRAHAGEAIYAPYIIFHGSSTVTYAENYADSFDGGAICTKFIIFIKGQQ